MNENSKEINKGDDMDIKQREIIIFGKEIIQLLGCNDTHNPTKLQHIVRYLTWLKQDKLLQVLFTRCMISFERIKYTMNDVYKSPLFTSWPNPFSGQSLKECFSFKKKGLKSKIKDKIKRLAHSSYFSNLFSTYY